jgi:hypothetical protein
MAMDVAGRAGSLGTQKRLGILREHIDNRREQVFGSEELSPSRTNRPIADMAPPPKLGLDTRE